MSLTGNYFALFFSFFQNRESKCKPRNTLSSLLKQRKISNKFLTSEFESLTKRDSSSKLNSELIDSHFKQELSPRAWITTAAQSMRSKLHQANFIKRLEDNVDKNNFSQTDDNANYDKKNRLQLDFSNSSNNNKLSKFDFGPSGFVSERFKPRSNLNFILKKRPLNKVEISPRLTQTVDSNSQTIVVNRGNKKGEELTCLIKKLKDDKILSLTLSKLSKMMLRKKIQDSQNKKINETDKKDFMMKSFTPKQTSQQDERSESTTTKKHGFRNKKLNLKLQTNFSLYGLNKSLNSSPQLTNLSNDSRYINNVSKIEVNF